MCFLIQPLGNRTHWKQALTRDDLNLYLHMQMEIPKAVKTTTIRVDIVRTVLADPSLESGKGAI